MNSLSSTCDSQGLHSAKPWAQVASSSCQAGHTQKPCENSLTLPRRPQPQVITHSDCKKHIYWEPHLKISSFSSVKYDRMRQEKDRA